MAGTAMIEKKEFLTWRTLRISGCKTHEEHVVVTNAAGHEIFGKEGWLPKQLFLEEDLSALKEGLEVVEILDSDLVAEPYTIKGLEAAAALNGLVPIPHAYVSFCMPSDYAEQPIGNFICRFALTHIKKSDLYVAVLDRDGLWVVYGHDHTVDVWSLGRVWVFARREFRPSD